MSKLGEITERVLELLRERDNVTIKELEREIPQTNTEVLEFLSQGGLIEMNDKEVSITRFGTEVITVG